MENSGGLIKNPFWIGSFDDQNNIIEHNLDCLKIPHSLPLQSIAHDYASSDSEDEELNDKEDGNVETHEVNAMSIQSGGENSYICEDFHL